jgi:hypothetical protein
MANSARQLVEPNFNQLNLLSLEKEDIANDIIRSIKAELLDILSREINEKFPNKETSLDQKVRDIEEVIRTMVAELIVVVKDSTPEKIALIVYKKMKTVILMNMKWELQSLQQSIDLEKQQEAQEKSRLAAEQEQQAREKMKQEHRQRKVAHAEKLIRELEAQQQARKIPEFNVGEFQYNFWNIDSLQIGDFGKVILLYRKSDNAYSLIFGNGVYSNLPSTLAEIQQLDTTAFTKVIWNHKDIENKEKDPVIWWGNYVFLWDKRILIFWSSGDFGYIPKTLLHACFTKEGYILESL